MAILCLATAACNLIVDVETDTITVDETVHVPKSSDDTALAPPGALVAAVAPSSDGGRAVSIARTLRVLSADESARILRDKGPDKIGSIRGVTLEVVSATYHGVDLTTTGMPTVIIGNHTLAPGTTSVDLDGTEVDHVRVALLTPGPLDLGLTFVFHEPKGASAIQGTVHVVVVVQPTLHVDIGRSW